MTSSFCRHLTNFAHRFFSSSGRQTELSLERREWQTVMCSNGVIACWHPPKQFPFEHSRTFNMEKAMSEKEKFLNRKADQTLFTMAPDDNALGEIFHTEKQEWRPIYREKRLYNAKVEDQLKPILSNPLETPTAPVITKNVENEAHRIEQGVNEGNNQNSLSE
ncbi:hypothetical protein niasHT_015764 [Heterodera trifolii]|uniref:Uncharacterized protein n=1 Tax=Heterodera trifolii TaxID=157864 RepID=A0ABD2L4R4_9BILA